MTSEALRSEATPHDQPEVTPGGLIGLERPDIRYVQKTPFRIPQGHLKLPIRPDVLHAFGIVPDADQSQLYLAQVVIEGGSYGGGTTWGASAHSAQRDLEDSNYGSIQINSGGVSISPEEALRVVDQWIRESPTTEWVPGEAVPLPMPDDLKPYFLGGLLLVRARDGQVAEPDAIAASIETPQPIQPRVDDSHFSADNCWFSYSSKHTKSPCSNTSL